MTANRPSRGVALAIADEAGENGWRGRVRLWLADRVLDAIERRNAQRKG